MNRTVEGFDDVVNVSQSESKSFDIMAVTRVYAVEFFKDFLQIFSFDANTIVRNHDNQSARLIACRDKEFEFAIGLFIFNGIVH